MQTLLQRYVHRNTALSECTCHKVCSCQTPHAAADSASRQKQAEQMMDDAEGAGGHGYS